jgi:hypothetical protein
MKYVESSYKGSADTLNVLLLNDLHIGAKSTNIDLLKKFDKKI